MGREGRVDHDIGRGKRRAAEEPPAVLTGRRYLLALTDVQTGQAERFGAICRAVWNTGLQQRREYRRRGAWINYVQQARQMAEAKKDLDCSWLAEAPSHIPQQTLRDLEKACQAHGTGKVRWRSKSRTAPAFRFPDPNQIRVERLNRRWGRVRLPKLGWVRFRWSRPLGGPIRNATVARDGGRWYISFCVEDGVTGVAPTDAPGVNVRQKAGLNRAILNKGWGGVLLALEHTARYHGATVVSVNPAYTSQRCSRCTLVDANSRKSQAEFTCTGCGHRDNADVNAAKNMP
nr:transposase [Actinoplanes capillaceus]